jgi:hypothetical protein
LKLTGTAELVDTGGGGWGGGRQRDVGLVILRFMRPGGLVSEVSDILLRTWGWWSSGLPLLPRGALPIPPGKLPILRKSKGCILCRRLSGDTLRGLLLMLLGGDDVVHDSATGGSFSRLTGACFWSGDMGGGGGGRVDGRLTWLGCDEEWCRPRWIGCAWCAIWWEAVVGGEGLLVGDTVLCLWVLWGSCCKFWNDCWCWSDFDDLSLSLSLSRSFSRSLSLSSLSWCLLGVTRLLVLSMNFLMSESILSWCRWEPGPRFRLSLEDERDVEEGGCKSCCASSNCWVMARVSPNLRNCCKTKGSSSGLQIFQRSSTPPWGSWNIDTALSLVQSPIWLWITNGYLRILVGWSTVTNRIWSRVRHQIMVIVFFFNLPIFPAALEPEAYSVCNRNEYHNYKKKFWGVERGRCVRPTVYAMMDPQRMRIL